MEMKKVDLIVVQFYTKETVGQLYSLLLNEDWKSSKPFFIARSSYKPNGYLVWETSEPCFVVPGLRDIRQKFRLIEFSWRKQENKGIVIECTWSRRAQNVNPEFERVKSALLREIDFLGVDHSWGVKVFSNPLFTAKKERVPNRRSLAINIGNRKQNDPRLAFRCTRQPDLVEIESVMLTR